MKVNKHTIEVLTETVISVIIIQFVIILVMIIALVCEYRMFADVVSNQYPTVMIADDPSSVEVGYY